MQIELSERAFHRLKIALWALTIALLIILAFYCLLASFHEVGSASSMLLGMTFGFTVVSGLVYFIFEPDMLGVDDIAGNLVSTDFSKQVQTWVAKEIGQKEKPLPIKDKLVAAVPAQVDREVAQLQQEAAGQEWTAFLQTRFNTTNIVEYFGRPFVDALIYFNNTLPSYVSDKGVGTKLENVPHWKAIEAFYTAFHRDHDKLYWDTIWLPSNSRKFGVYTSADGKLYDWGSPRFYDSLTSGLPLGELFRPDQDVKVAIPQKLFMQSTWCLAPSGRGKTTVLSSIVKSQLEEVRNGGASIIIMDAKADLTKLKRAKIFGKGGDLEGRLSVIEPWKDLALNPFVLPDNDDEESVIEGIRYLLNSILEVGTSEMMRPILTRATMVVRKHPKPSLQVLMDLIGGDYKNFEREIRQLPKKHADWFASFWNEHTNLTSRMALHRRLDAFLLKSGRMTDMFLAEETRVKLRHEMDSGRVIVINNSREALTEGVEFFSRFFLMLIYNAVMTRNEYSIPVYFYLDEADLAIANDPLAAEIMNRCRSKRIGILAAHQNAEQIKNSDVMAALRNSSVLIANSQDDASRLSQLFHTSPDALRGLKEGEFLLWMYNVAGMPVKVKPDKKEHVEFWDKMSDEEYEKIEAEMRRRYCYKPKQRSPDKVDTAPVKWQS